MMRIRSGDTLFLSSAAVIGSVFLAHLIPDLTALPEGSVSHASIFDPTLPVAIPPIEHPACVTPESFWKQTDLTQLVPNEPKLRPKYYEGLERRVKIFTEPVAVDGKPVSPTDIELIREVVFEKINYNTHHPTSLSADGDVCSEQRYYADVKYGPRTTGGALVTNEYPALVGRAPEKRLWILTHELGHAIDLVVQASSKFNTLSLEDRMVLLEELQTLREALAAKGYTVSYSNGKELFANLYASLLLEPDLAETYAPKASKFFGGLVNEHPELGKILHFK